MRMSSEDLRTEPEPIDDAPSTTVWRMQIAVALAGLVTGLVLLSQLLG